MVRSVKGFHGRCLLIAVLLLMQTPVILALEFIDCPTEVSGADLRNTTIDVPNGWSYNRPGGYLGLTFQLTGTSVDMQSKTLECVYGFFREYPALGPFHMVFISRPIPPAATNCGKTVTGFICESKAKQ